MFLWPLVACRILSHGLIFCLKNQTKDMFLWSLVHVIKLHVPVVICFFCYNKKRFEHGVNQLYFFVLSFKLLKR
jgi:hypothetical protein